MEIENENYEKERRAKNEQIVNLENHAKVLNEKLIMLKMEFEEKNTQEQEIKSRLKMDLKELTEELVSLKKRRNDLFIKHLENTSIVKKNIIKEHIKGNNKNYKTVVIKQSSDEHYNDSYNYLEEKNIIKRQTSIKILNCNYQDLEKDQIKSKNPFNNQVITSVEQVDSKQELKHPINKENKK